MALVLAAPHRFVHRNVKSLVEGPLHEFAVEKRPRGNSQRVLYLLAEKFKTRLTFYRKYHAIRKAVERAALEIFFVGLRRIVEGGAEHWHSIPNPLLGWC